MPSPLTDIYHIITLLTGVLAGKSLNLSLLKYRKLHLCYLRIRTLEWTEVL